MVGDSGLACGDRRMAGGVEGDLRAWFGKQRDLKRDAPAARHHDSQGLGRSPFANPDPRKALALGADSVAFDPHRLRPRQQGVGLGSQEVEHRAISLAAQRGGASLSCGLAVQAADEIADDVRPVCPAPPPEFQACVALLRRNLKPWRDRL